MASFFITRPIVRHGDRDPHRPRWAHRAAGSALAQFPDIVPPQIIVDTTYTARTPSH